MTVVIVVRSHLRHHSVVLVEIVQRVEIVVVRPRLQVDPHLILFCLQPRAGPAELNTQVVVVVVVVAVVRSLLGTDPTHHASVKDDDDGQQSHQHVKHLKKLPPSS